MSDSLQKMLLVFAVAMVAMIALLLALQVAFGSITEDEPEMINPRSLAVAAFFAAGLTLAFGGFGKPENHR